LNEDRVSEEFESSFGAITELLTSEKLTGKLSAATVQVFACVLCGRDPVSAAVSQVITSHQKGSRQLSRLLFLAAGSDQKIKCFREQIFQSV